jgi:hypothetical protein
MQVLDFKAKLESNGCTVLGWESGREEVKGDGE